MLPLVGVEFLKLRKRLMTLVLSLVMVALVPGMLLILFASLEALKTAQTQASGVTPEQIAQMRSSLLFPAAVPSIMSLISFGGVLLSIILAAGAVGGEYSWGTVRTMVINAPGRIRFLLAKLLAILAVGAIWILVGLVLGSLTTLLITVLLGESFDFSFFTASYAWEVLLMLGRTGLSIFPYMLLGFWLTVLGRSLLAGIAGGLGYYFVESIAVDFMRQAGGWVEAVAKGTLRVGSTSLMALNGRTGSVGINTGIQTAPGYLDWGWATGSLLAYSAFFIVFSLVLFRKRDISQAH